MEWHSIVWAFFVCDFVKPNLGWGFGFKADSRIYCCSLGVLSWWAWEHLQRCDPRTRPDIQDRKPQHLNPRTLVNLHLEQVMYELGEGATCLHQFWASLYCSFNRSPLAFLCEFLGLFLGSKGLDGADKQTQAMTLSMHSCSPLNS